MKIATYNVWNENKGKGSRFQQLIQEINTVDADIIGLQEVTPYFYNEVLIKETTYKYHIYGKYPNEDEGLAILSKYPITNYFTLYDREEFDHSIALNVLFEVNELKFSFTNVHLPSESIKNQENQIIAIDRYLQSQQEKADFFILLGDFNGGIDSSVNRYLIGDQTLHGYESTPYWNELSSAYAAFTGQSIKATLDIINNPRWAGKKTLYTPSTMDRIYIMENWFNTSLESVHIFGTDISPINHLSASDHYGVIAEVTFNK